MVELIDHATPGPVTGLDGVSSEALATVAGDAVEICSPTDLIR